MECQNWLTKGVSTVKLLQRYFFLFERLCNIPLKYCVAARVVHRIVILNFGVFNIILSKLLFVSFMGSKISLKEISMLISEINQHFYAFINEYFCTKK